MSSVNSSVVATQFAWLLRNYTGRNARSCDQSHRDAALYNTSDM